MTHLVEFEIDGRVCRRFTREFVLGLSESQNHRCAYCGMNVRLPGEEMSLVRNADFADRRTLRRAYTLMYATVDHLQPRSKGGSDDPDNLVMACRCCNSIKGTHPAEAAFVAIRSLIGQGLHPLVAAMTTGTMPSLDPQWLELEISAAVANAMEAA
ncbi:HNH endonuclease [Stappia sp. 22II-S9-Z10]|nr:HNH endonuclease [Stappia sp. 22II-S9-Z10]